MGNTVCTAECTLLQCQTFPKWRRSGETVEKWYNFTNACLTLAWLNKVRILGHLVSFSTMIFFLELVMFVVPQKKSDCALINATMFGPECRRAVEA